MNRSHNTPEQIVRKPREVDQLPGEGTPWVQVCKPLEVTEATYRPWRNQYGGMKADDAKRLKDLGKENARLKRSVAEQALDINMFTGMTRGNCQAGGAVDHVMTMASSVVSL